MVLGLPAWLAVKGPEGYRVLAMLRGLQLVCHRGIADIVPDSDTLSLVMDIRSEKPIYSRMGNVVET